MAYKLVSPDRVLTFELRNGAALIVGRAPTSDIPVIDPTVSRRHAAVKARRSSVTVRDLDSSNGTFLNGRRVDRATVAVGDVIAFGNIAFQLEESPNTLATPVVSPATPAPVPANPTIVRRVPLHEPGAGIDDSRERLAVLLEVSKQLGRTMDIDALLARIADHAYRLLRVDRVAIHLLDDAGLLVPKMARDAQGDDAARAVPQSIARTALDDRVAILSDNASQDTRFGGQSIRMQQIRSAICVPLLGADDRPLGILYLDNVTASNRFGDDDLELCIAFAGISAMAIDNSQFAQRMQREVVARSNFERFFTPQLAERIAHSPDTIRLGGDKRAVAVLFSDIRGFTALAESMRPDEMAALLSEYFTQMVECVFRHDGTLDKFIGDAVMAQWGAPVGGPDDADKAMAAALDMMRALAALNSRWRAAGRPELEIGIGLNFGEVFAGNIGSERRLEFTVIGDSVNVAKRLCDHAPAGGILVSDDFRRALHDAPPLEACEPLTLKNKSQPVTVYRVLTS